jgi:hypothetical protein
MLYGFSGFLGGRRAIANVGFLPRGAGAIATPPTRRGFVLLDARHPCRFNPLRAAKV